MPAKNIECQLAQGQIGRYLAGVDMSPEAVGQLEQHISECGDCEAYIEEKKRALQEMAGTTHAAVAMPAPQPAQEPETKEASRPLHPAAQALLKALKEKSAAADQTALETAREPAPKKSAHWKAFAFSAALGAVLLAMSHLTANPTALFGERAAEPTASEPAAAETAVTNSTATTPPGDPFAESAAPELASEPAPAEPASSDAALTATPAATPAGATAAAAPAPPKNTISPSSTPTQPNVQVRSRPVRRAARKPVRRSRPAQTRPAGGNSIRVYDENGRPLTGG
jgi:hypothetical protein